MGCILALFALISPRLVLVLVWIFANSFLSNAYDNFIIPLLGFIFLPLTTLAWAWVANTGAGVEGLGIIVLIVAVLLDLGLIGGGGLGGRRR